MRFAQVSGILNAVAAEADIVGLAITEYLPWSVIEFASSEARESRSFSVSRRLCFARSLGKH